MKNLLLIAVAFTIFSLPVLAAERHTEESAGFSYEVPSNWRVMEFPGLKFKIIITDPIDDFSPNMTLVDEKYEGSLEAYEKASIPHMEKAIPGFGIISRMQAKTIDGKDFRSVTYKHEANNGTIIQTANFLELRAGHKLVMTCTSPKGHEDKIELQCNKVVRSLRVN